LLVMLDELSPVPYHEQLSNILREQIASGAIEHRVPSLSTLSQEYGVSRNTVIHALATLESEGLIVTVQGRGTFVVKR
jgi:GntR family transcriptional regulator